MREHDNRAGVGLVAAVTVAAVVMLAAVCGVVIAFALSGTEAASNTETAEADALKQEGDYSYVSYGTVVSNLAEGRLTRYVKVNITLKLQQAQGAQVTKMVTGEQKAVFNNWLISYMSGKELEDVRGTNAMNRLRNEIRDGFNAILAEHGGLRVEEVLFEEFNVQ